MKLLFEKELRVINGFKLNGLDLLFYFEETYVSLASIQTALVDFKDRIFVHNIETAMFVSTQDHVDPQKDWDHEKKTFFKRQIRATII